MILRVYDCLRKRRCEFPKPATRVTGIRIQYRPDVEACPGSATPSYPERVEWHCMQSEKEKGAVVMSLQFETSAALIEDVNARKVRT